MGTPQVLYRVAPDDPASSKQYSQDDMQQMWQGQHPVQQDVQGRTGTGRSVTFPGIPQPVISPALDQRAKPATPQAAAPQATIGSQAQPETMAGRYGQWAENVANDLKYGTDRTKIGSVMQALTAHGFHGIYAGNPQAVADFMLSLPLGLLRATKGGAEVTQEGQRMQGMKDIALGALQGSQMPTAFAGLGGGTGAEEAATGAGQAARAGEEGMTAEEAALTPEQLADIDKQIRSARGISSKVEGTPKPARKAATAAPKKAAAPQAEAEPEEEDLTSLLERSLAKVRGQKSK
jgi:hypothetical protein